MQLILLSLELLGYLLAARLILRHLQGNFRELVMAALNLESVYLFLFCNDLGQYPWTFAIYVALIIALYGVMRLFAGRGRLRPWLAFFAPIGLLVLVRYLPAAAYSSLVSALGAGQHGVPKFIGISYLAFRCSRLVLEVRNGAVGRPNLLQYLNFAFFLPTLPVGPINTYANFRKGFAPQPYEVPVGRAALRILVGAVKFQCLGNFCKHLGYEEYLLNGYYHSWLALPVTMLAYYCYLYCNFSGFCDMAIGAAGLIGIPVPENFNNPFAARNVKDFWNRWHLTLSAWMREVVFSPLSKFLVGTFGLSRANHAIALAIAIVFLLVGIWHGAGWNFAVYGAVHAVGVAANHYYTLFLKRRLGRDGLKAYNENPWIRAAAVALTFCYCGASLIFFANTLPQIKRIVSALQ